MRNIEGDTAESDLGILWYDEDNGVFVEQEQVILDSANNTITLELEHFSEYILVDLNIFNNAMPRVYTIDDRSDVEPTHYNVTFAVDTSSFMDATEREEAIRTINTVLGTLEAGDRVSICTLRGTSISYSRFVDASTMPSLSNSYQSNIRNHQGTNQANLYLYNEAAEQNLFNCGLRNDDNTNIIIFITDGNSIYSDNLPGVRLMIEHRYTYYTVFTGDLYNSDLADVCSRHRGGTCQAGSDEVSRIILHGNEGTFLWTDNDGDGIPDILEEEGMVSKSGVVFYSDPTNPDTDGDGLTDGEEMGEMYSIRRIDEATVQIGATQIEIDEIGFSEYAWTIEYIPENTGEICFVFEVQSDPQNDDTDGDGIPDLNDASRLVEAGQINYIIVGVEDDSIVSCAEAYKSLYDEEGLEYYYYIIDSYDSFQDFMQTLNCARTACADDKFNENCIDSETIYYSGVNNIVIVTHGGSQSITLGGDVSPIDIWCIVNGYFGESGIPCDINVIDLQACHLAEVYDGDWPSFLEERLSGYSIARTFLCENGLHRVNHVYAWKGTSSFMFGYNETGPSSYFYDDAGYYSFSLDCPEGTRIGRRVEYTTTYEY